MTLQPADAGFIETLEAQLPPDTVRRAEARYLQEPRGRWQGPEGWVALPRNTQEVATIVRAASAACVGVVPYGGGTGLVGGQVAQETPCLTVSLERMSGIRRVLPEENVLIAEAGAILVDVQAAAQEVDRLFPLSLASEGSARIGGLLATNAGGVNTLRYGNARALCLGLEAVMPNGEIWHGLKRLRKDNTGYDLRNLLMGSEGTLGILTAASLQLSPRPSVYGTAMMVVSSPEAALQLLALARTHFGEAVSAFELMSAMGFGFLRSTLPDIRVPFDSDPAWSVLLEVGLFGEANVDGRLAALFEAAFDAGLVEDGVIAQSETQRLAFWSVREHIPEANRRIGAVSSHDISVPLGAIPEFIILGHEAIAAIGDFRINCFGHVGDGNLHFNIFPVDGRSRADHQNQRDAIKTAIHDLTDRLGGSVSAEHGVGRLKVADLERYSDPAKLAAMHAIKSALDPKGIMNPGSVLRQSA